MLRSLSPLSLSITWGHVQIILYLIQKVWVSFQWTGKIKRIGKMQHTRRDNPKKKGKQNKNIPKNLHNSYYNQTLTHIILI